MLRISRSPSWTRFAIPQCRVRSGFSICCVVEWLRESHALVPAVDATAFGRGEHGARRSVAGARGGVGWRRVPRLLLGRTDPLLRPQPGGTEDLPPVPCARTWRGHRA